MVPRGSSETTRSQGSMHPGLHRDAGGEEIKEQGIRTETGRSETQCQQASSSGVPRVEDCGSSALGARVSNPDHARNQGGSQQVSSGVKDNVVWARENKSLADKIKIQNLQEQVADKVVEKRKEKFKADNGEWDEDELEPFVGDSLSHDGKDMRKGKFRFLNARALLTYKHHLDKKQLKRHLKDIAKYHGWQYEGEHEKFNVTKFECIIAHETSDKKNKYDHTHVYINFSRQVSARECNFLDFTHVHEDETEEVIHCNIKVVKKTPERVIAYVCKQDPALEELREQYPLDKIKFAKGDKKSGDGFAWFDAIQGCTTLEQAYRLARGPGDFPGIEKAFQLRKKVGLMILHFKPYGWQLDFLKLVSGRPNFRTINWWFERLGKSGKNTIAQWLMATQPTKFFAIQGLSKVADVAEQLKNALHDGWDGHCIIINLPRIFEDKDYIATCLEVIKDGLISSTKYSGRTMVFNPPHVVVFANWPFNNILKKVDYKGNVLGTQLRLSVDRVKLTEIKPSEDRGDHWVEEIPFTPVSFGPEIDTAIQENKQSDFTREVTADEARAHHEKKEKKIAAKRESFAKAALKEAGLHVDELPKEVLDQIARATGNS